MQTRTRRSEAKPTGNLARQAGKNLLVGGELLAEKAVIALKDVLDGGSNETAILILGEIAEFGAHLSLTGFGFADGDLPTAATNSRKLIDDVENGGSKC